MHVELCLECAAHGSNTFKLVDQFAAPMIKLSGLICQQWMCNMPGERHLRVLHASCAGDIRCYLKVLFCFSAMCCNSTKYLCVVHCQSFANLTFTQSCAAELLCFATVYDAYQRAFLIFASAVDCRQPLCNCQRAVCCCLCARQWSCAGT